MQHHGQSGQGPHRASAGDGSIRGVRVLGQHDPNRLGPLLGRFHHPGPLLPGQALGGVQLPPQSGRAQGDAGDRMQMVGIANARLEAPAAEIEPEDRLVSHPHAGPLTEKTEACLLLARQQVDRAADHPFEPAEQLLAVGGVAQGGGGEGHHHVDLRFVGGGPESAHGPDRRGCPVSRDPSGPGDFGSQVEKRPSTEHRRQHAVAAGIHHHQMERATPEIEHGHSHSRHRRDATAGTATPDRRN